MKRKLLFLILPVIITCCYYDNEEALYPDAGGECDTLDVSFNYTIIPILSTYCYTCHSNQNAPVFGNNTHLQDYADVSENSEKIIGAINHDPQSPQMPLGGSKLNDCLIFQFEAWVNQGKQNN